MTIIDRFFIKGEGHNPLSNFWVGEPFIAAPFGTEYANRVLTWLTAEHYYQAAKFFGEADILYVAEAPTPGQAKRRGRERRPTFRDDWEALKYNAMRVALDLKFCPGREEYDFLMATGDALLVEGNDWGDKIWGAVKDEDGEYTNGQNWLGWLLMAKRAELRSQVPFQIGMAL